MKKQLSVFGLFARSSIFKVLGILFLMGAVETLSFGMDLRDALEAYEAGELLPSLERIFSQAATNAYFRVALVLITVVLCLPGCEFKSHTSYTLRRLSVRERTTFLHQAAYNSLVYGMLFAAQLAIVYGLSIYYIAAAPGECVSNQTLTLAFYRNAFLHTLLPLEDIGLWIRNGLLIVCLGLTTAEYPYSQRRKKFSANALALVMYTIVYFDREIGDLLHAILMVFIALMVIGAVIYALMKKDEEVIQYE